MLLSFDEFSNKFYKGTIILITNVYGKTRLINGNKLNIISEFFSEEEFNYILTSLKECDYNVVCYFDENDFISDFLNNKIKYKDYLVFNLARNGYGIGKKSLIPTFCDLNNIKYTASNGYACSFSRNKFHVNALLSYLGLNALESYVYNDGWLNNVHPNKTIDKYIIKPLSESASQGINSKSIYSYQEANISLDKYVKIIFKELNNTPLIVQKFIEGYEAKTTIVDLCNPYALPTVGVEIDKTRYLGNKIISSDIAFNYNHTNYILSSEFGEDFANKIAIDAVNIYNYIGMQNYGRIDCRIEAKTNKVYFMDFSTMPYFVSNGEMLFAFESLGKDIHGLLNTIINSALQSKYKINLYNT